MNVRQLDGVLLNLWVAKAAGLQFASADPIAGECHNPDSGYWHPSNYIPAYDWSQAGSIVANEWFGIEDMLVDWFGPEWTRIKDIVENPLKWFMRAYVATQYGNEVEDVHIVKSLAPDRSFLESPQQVIDRLQWTEE
jgi:hypothetical protein